jgi:hypothetical protein
MEEHNIELTDNEISHIEFEEVEWLYMEECKR